MPLTVLTLACAHTPSLRVPTAVELAKTDWRAVTTFLDSAVTAGAAPGCVLGVSVAGNRFIYATGRLGADEAARAEPTTVYDLASLTKVVALSTAVMFAVDDGRLDLDAPVRRYVPAFTGDDKERITVRMLLAHTGGLPAWRPLFREASSRTEAFALADSTPLTSPPGVTELYSDLGSIVLTQTVEAVYHERLDSLVQRRIFQPLGMTSVRFLPPAGVHARIAPTELDPWRGRVLRGEVHDENAARLDGVSGHAGLFGSAPDLLTFAEWLVRGWNEGTGEQGKAVGVTGSIVPPFPRALHEFTRRQELVSGSSRALGWDTPAPGSSAGTFLSATSFGHTGFTGTSLWIDPQHHLAIVLLSNRVNPTRNNSAWAGVRATVADLVMTTLFEDLR
ncbi:MAG TPA: serine hydrolase domain-containing protein [Gemmatimonadales bacterium]|nr:serine hydrolase domain-containing protein [Gemmatimonadales bacterium]